MLRRSRRTKAETTDLVQEPTASSTGPEELVPALAASIVDLEGAIGGLQELIGEDRVNLRARVSVIEERMSVVEQLLELHGVAVPAPKRAARKAKARAGRTKGERRRKRTSGEPTPEGAPRIKRKHQRITPEEAVAFPEPKAKRSAAERRAQAEAQQRQKSRELHEKRLAKRAERAALKADELAQMVNREWAGLGDQDAAADDKVVVGRDGWVFLAKDSNRVLAQHTGELLFDALQLQQWRSLLEERDRWVRSRGATFTFVVPPNPHSVYPEKLPDDIVMGETRPVLQLLDELRANESPVRCLYLLDELAAVKDSEIIYPKTDSHWTALGAFIAYQAMLDSLPDTVERRILDVDEVEFREAVFPGGLGAKLSPPVASKQIVATIGEPGATVLDDNRVNRNGRIIRFECPTAPATSCVLFGDSFSYAMLRYLAESFGRFTFVHLPTLDRALVEAEAADVVISSCNERFLIRVPDDDSPPAEQVAAEKREAGDVFTAEPKESLKLLWP